MTNKHFYIAFPAIYCNAVLHFSVLSLQFSFRLAYQSKQQQIIGYQSVNKGRVLFVIFI